jgi:hypothetical protein
MKLAVNLFLSLAMLVACLWLVWPNAAQAHELEAAFRGLELATFGPYLATYLLLLALTHFCRAWRWQNLLRPIGVELGGPRLLAISSVGFMAILALPARLGEFVRPALIRRKGEVSATAALGTVAVERIVDGLMVSLFVFGALFALRGPDAPGWMMPTAYTALAVFAAALVFLVFAVRWPEATTELALTLSLLRSVAPALADKIKHRLLQMMSGFLVLGDKRNLAVFVLWSVLYWAANGLSVWILALGFDLDLSLLGAFATMGLVAVGITLPNSPGLVGQYQAFTKLGLSLYLPAAVVDGRGLAYAIVLHGLQVIWYLGVGAIALATPYVSFAEAVSSSAELESE